MPCTVTAFSVKIASPGDEAMESVIAREVIYEWNALHSLEQKQVLLPLYARETRQCSPADLLITFFCASQGSPGDQTALDADAEIERQLQAGRPVLVYFSEARVDLIGTQALPSRAPGEFKKHYTAATVDSYGDEKEFRAKFARHLEETIGTHAYFKSDAPVPPARADLPAAPTRLPAGKLSACAQTILIEACDDFEAYIGRIKVGDSLKIQANGKQLVEQGHPEVVAKWESAMEELLAGGFIRDAGCNGQLFQISTKGFAFLKGLGKSPVGYIAEMGGM